MYILSLSLSKKIHGPKAVKEHEEYLKKKPFNGKLSKIDRKCPYIDFDCLHVLSLTCTLFEL